MAEIKPYIFLLTSRPSGWASGRFRQAAKKRGVKIRASEPSKAMLEIGADSTSIRFARRKLSRPISVLPRLGPGNYDNGLAILSHFEASGIPVCNTSDAIGLARDTYRTLLKLRSAGLKVPRTARLLNVKDLKPARKSIPGPPWILKTFTGAMGIGTMYICEIDQLEAITATLWALDQPVLMQEYIHPADGAPISDIRALIVGGRVIGAIRRSAAPDEIRTNVHRGGMPEAVQLTKRESVMALKAARATGLGIAGVDWIETPDGPVFIEVNATPGFQGFESATRIDAAGAMIEFAVNL